MNSDSASSGYCTGEWTLRHGDTDALTSNNNNLTAANITYVVPVHFPGEPVPLITSQYWPSGSEVVNAAFQSESSLLIATYPIEPQTYCQYDSYTNNNNKEQPRPKAICCGCGDIQLVIGAEPTALRNPTMPLIAVNRCWQYQPPLPPLAVQVPEPVAQLWSEN